MKKEFKVFHGPMNSVNRDQEIISYFMEQMREATPEKTAIFVEGKRVRRSRIDDPPK